MVGSVDSGPGSGGSRFGDGELRHLVVEQLGPGPVGVLLVVLLLSEGCSLSGDVNALRSSTAVVLTLLVFHSLRSWQVKQMVFGSAEVVLDFQSEVGDVLLKGESHVLEEALEIFLAVLPLNVI